MNVYGLYKDLHWEVQGVVHGLAEAPLMKHACEVFLTLDAVLESISLGALGMGGRLFPFHLSTRP